MRPALRGNFIGSGDVEFTEAERDARNRDQEQAMEALSQAVDQGWANVVWMKNDPDLFALHGRVDLQDQSNFSR